ncbi:MAG: flagellar biosynthetic protein FliR, partial [Demequina sp.]|uniref:flagellar biosynthetic protein FliR n=1 Tax=Demequina sp. TaxID=2050685 RepID=UPI003A87910A
QAFDPVSGSQGSVFSKFYYMAALALLFASDAYQVVIGGVVRSFEVVPLGMGLDLDGLASLMTSGLTGLMVSALQIAGPLLVVLFLADVGLGLLTRVAPALNAFALGFPLKILITLVLGSVAFLALPQVIAALTDRAFGAMTGGGL